MKSFAFGAASALLAAYTVADDPQHAASAEQPHVASHVSYLEELPGSSRTVEHRPDRGMPPFWGRNGVTIF